MFWNKYPNTDYYRLQLDYVLSKIKTIEEISQNIIAALLQINKKINEAETYAENAENSSNNAEEYKELARDYAQNADNSYHDTLAIQQQLQAKTNQIDNNTARLDNLIIEGTPTQGNAELIDIRTSYDNRIFNLAGDCTRYFEKIADFAGKNGTSVNLIEYYNSGTVTSQGITYTYNGDGSYTINGTATGTSFCNLFQSSLMQINDLPRKMYLKIVEDVPIQVYVRTSTQNGYNYIPLKNNIINIPKNTTSVIVRFRCNTETTYTNKTVKPYLYLLPPGIADNVLFPQDSVEPFNYERGVDINETLQNYGTCILMPGVYIITTPINMPIGSTLIGNGRDTILNVTNETNGILLNGYNDVSNILITGSLTDITPTTLGLKKGISFSGTYPTERTDGCNVHDVWIENFTHSGLYCDKTSINYAQCLRANNIQIKNCYYGIYNEFFSEFNKYVNCVITNCYVATVCNAGNCSFIGCTFHASTIGFLLDNSQNDKNNNGHGILDACTFCHIGSNEGIAIKFDSTGSGYIVSNCQFHYNSIEILNSSCVQINGCQFGRGVTSGRGQKITISGGNCNVISNCIFNNDVNYPPEIIKTNNTKSKMIECYGANSGNLIDFS